MQFDNRSCSIQSSIQQNAEFDIRSGPGLDRWTGPMDGIWAKKIFFFWEGGGTGRPCRIAGQEIAHLKVGPDGPDAKKKKFWERGGTVMPLGTGRQTCLAFLIEVLPTGLKGIKGNSHWWQNLKLCFQGSSSTSVYSHCFFICSPSGNET